MTVRVIQWATGPVGAAALREVIDSPELELVGVFAYSANKIGVDAGALVNRGPTGVFVTGDKAEILAQPADLVLHAASKAFGDDTTGDVVALLESGKNVITTTSYNHLPTYGADACARITDACLRNGVRFHAAGEHPGYVFERLATSLTALSQRVDRITVQEFVDCSGISQRSMLVDLMGMGKRPEDITIDSPMFRAVSLQYEQALAATADVLGLDIDRIERGVETTTHTSDVVVRCATLPAGTVVAQRLTWTAYRRGSRVLVAEELWSTSTELLGWQVPGENQFLVRVRIDGSPALQLDLTIGNEPIADLDTSGGQLAVAMTAVRAIPDVLRAPPGVVIAPVFGAYQWQS
ncbi:dihydrodipicolinate synthase [Mycobacterium sp.]|uniref:NAD(P)H-dependent amine dehydrogenase family protein n=1 Tax=Mycobacterium sp. TaxID=1785 RepID=UPI002D821B5E|nr:dihydrodipicolinate synthase [Mycobacterium sp.]